MIKAVCSVIVWCRARFSVLLILRTRSCLSWVTTASTLLRPSATVWVLRTVVPGGTSLEKLSEWTGHWPWHRTPSNRKKNRWHKSCITQPLHRAGYLFLICPIPIFCLYLTPNLIRPVTNTWSVKAPMVTLILEFYINMHIAHIVRRSTVQSSTGRAEGQMPADSCRETGSSGGEKRGQTKTSGAINTCSHTGFWDLKVDSSSLQPVIAANSEGTKMYQLVSPWLEGKRRPLIT